MFFLLFAAFTLYLSCLPLDLSGSAEAAPNGTADLRWISVAALGILLASVVLHELGHYHAALRLGGDAEEIIIGPLGGLAPMQAPPTRWAEFFMHLAGPAVNLAICAGCGVALLFSEEARVAGLINPLAPRGLTVGPWAVQGIQLAFWINWCLLLLNLLPAFPFDGGRALRAALRLVWQDSNARWPTVVAAVLARVAAAALLVLAFLLRNNDPHGRVPMWFSLVLLAIFLWFSA